MEKQVEKALMLRKSGELINSNQLLVSLINSNSKDAELNYQVAWSYDLIGQEKQAIAYYVKAIELGLPKEQLSGALLGLGSTYRCLGNYQEAREIFEQAITIFPKNQSFQVFYAMTLHNLKKHGQSFELLLKTLLKTTHDTDVLTYKKALDFYADHLDEIFDE